MPSSPILLPAASIPRKSPDLLSAYKWLGNGAICQQLDQVRGRAKLVGQEHVDRIDAAITFLTLDMGYDAEEVSELMQQAFKEIIQEADVHRKGLKRKKGYFSGSGKVG
jgi:hypothetical protein